ncbi:MAG: hypothetical protein D6806_14395 [Deltaproteobacteria bacterium]|nr:MAG: hypothetical protein D6806_14395 [Deltaproteobacteria bacterium]
MAGPTGRLPALFPMIERIRSRGASVEVYAEAGLEQLARGRLNLATKRLDAETTSELIERLDYCRAIVLSGIGMGLARRLAEGDDEAPVARLAWRALLSGKPVLADRADLLPAAAPKSRAADIAAGALRELEHIGMECLPAASMAPRIERLLDAPGTAERALSGLLTEEEVERLAAEGHRTLVLEAGTIVTPLAKSRAAELGLELRWTE